VSGGHQNCLLPTCPSRVEKVPDWQGCCLFGKRDHPRSVNDVLAVEIRAVVDPLHLGGSQRIRGMCRFQTCQLAQRIRLDVVAQDRISGLSRASFQYRDQLVQSLHLRHSAGFQRASVLFLCVVGCFHQGLQLRFLAFCSKGAIVRRHSRRYVYRFLLLCIGQNRKQNTHFQAKNYARFGVNTGRAQRTSKRLKRISFLSVP